jgi:hypothetical protein
MASKQVRKSPVTLTCEFPGDFWAILCQDFCGPA